jgi:hypothetical protein
MALHNVTREGYTEAALNDKNELSIQKYFAHGGNASSRSTGK